MQVNGHALYVETDGPEDGQAVALLHHGLGSVRAWRAQIPALTEAGFRVIAYDRWGFGRSSARSEQAQPLFEADRKDLYALMDALDVERAALVGHSDGGTLALYFAADHPERTTHVVTAAAHIYVEDKMKTGIDRVRETFQTDERFREGLRRQHGDRAGQVFESWYFGWRRSENLTWDMRPVLARIACPALVVQGLEDEHATPQHARDTAGGIPGAELWLEPGTAHMLPQEKAEVFNRRLVEFLRR